MKHMTGALQGVAAAGLLLWIGAITYLTCYARSSAAADLRRRLVSASSNEGDFFIVASEAMNWPEAWMSDPDVRKAIGYGASRGWRGAYMLAHHIDGDKYDVWQGACETMARGPEFLRGNAARALSNIDRNIPEWVMERVWALAVEVCLSGGGGLDLVVAQAAVNSIADSESGKEFLWRRWSAAGEEVRGAWSHLALSWSMQELRTSQVRDVR